MITAAKSGRILFPPSHTYLADVHSYIHLYIKCTCMAHLYTVNLFTKMTCIAIYIHTFSHGVRAWHS